MIALSFPNIIELERMHFSAVRSYVFQIMHRDARSALYRSVVALPGFDDYDEDYEEGESGCKWLRQFILADYSTLCDWANYHAEKLKFDYMKKLYLNRFSKSPEIFVDKDNTYNSYTLFRHMDIKVCPYCEHEFLDEVEIEGLTRRTMEFDHFFPKGSQECPGLAMCFYNLIPSCKPCNQLKMINPVAASPYHAGIEQMSHLCPDLELGVNMETVSVDECKIKLHPKGGMVVNNRSLALEQRYEKASSLAYDLLKKKQQYSEEKLEEMERLGFGNKESIKRDLFGLPRHEAKGKELHTKMKEDLIGW